MQSNNTVVSGVVPPGASVWTVPVWPLGAPVASRRNTVNNLAPPRDCCGRLMLTAAQMQAAGPWVVGPAEAPSGAPFLGAGPGYRW
jgi:hypothetical protein